MYGIWLKDAAIWPFLNLVSEYTKFVRVVILQHPCKFIEFMYAHGPDHGFLYYQPMSKLKNSGTNKLRSIQLHTDR